MSTKPISLALRAEGISEVKSALQGVKQSFVDMEKESLAATKAASKERIAILRGESKEKIALAKHESSERKKIAESERDFKRTLGGGAGASGAFGVGSTSELMKQAGASGAVFAVFSSAINMASAALRQFSGFVINDVIKPAMALQTRSQQVANSSGGLFTAAGVQSRSRAIGLRNGMDSMSIIDSAGRFQDLTGEPGMGMDMMGTIAAISKGRGYDAKSMTELAAAMYRPGQKSGDLQQLLLTLTGAGEKGSIPIGELARLGGRLTAPAGKFGGDWFTQVTTGNALLQTAKRTGFGTVDEAATGYGKFVEEAFTKGRAVSPKSFATVDGVEKITDPVKYLADIYRKTSGSAVKLHGMGFSEESLKFVGAYSGTFSDAYKGAKGAGKTDAQAKEAGAQAIEDFVNGMAKQTSTMADEEGKRNAVMATAGEEFSTGLAAIEAQVGAKLMPEVQKLADTFIEHAPEIASAAIVLSSALVSAAGIIVDIANVALVPAAGIIVDIANGMARVAGWFNKAGEGDVLKTVRDRGDKTKLNAPAGEKGYWRKGDGVYEFIKNEQGEMATKDLQGVSRRSAIGNGQIINFPNEAPAAPMLGPLRDPQEARGPLTPSELAELGHNQSAVDPGSHAAFETAADAAKRHAVAVDAATKALHDFAAAGRDAARNKSFVERR